MKLLSTLLALTLYSAVLFAAIMAFKAVFRKSLSPALHLAVWFLLIARLCIPFTIESGFHLFTVEQPASAVTAAVLEEQALPLPQTDVAAPATQPDKTPAAPQALPATPDAAPAFTLSWPAALIALWVMGMAWRAAKLLLTARRLRRDVAQNGVAPNVRIQRAYAACVADMAVKCPPRVVMLPGITTPALTVGPRPVILLPRALCAGLGDEGLCFVLRHELTHYRQGDHLLCVLLRLLETVYWFNPVVWRMGREITRDMETACDSRATAQFTYAQRRAYALTLLDLFAQPAPARYVLGMALPAAEKDAERRVRGVFKARKSKPVAKLTAALLCAVLLLGCFTTACQPAPEQTAAPGQSAAPAALPAPSQPAAAPYTPYAAPARMAGERAYYDGKLKIVYDAGVYAPEGPFPVYVLEDAAFTRAETETFVRVLMGGQPLRTLQTPWTKARVLNKLLQPARENLAKLRAGESVGTDAGPYTEENLMEAIAAYEAMYAEAPEQESQIEITAADYVAGEQFNVAADLGGPVPAELRVQDNYMMFHKDMYYLVGDHGAMDLQAEPAGLRVTREEAVTMAGTLVRELGAGHLALSAVGVGIRGDGSEYDIASEAYQNTQAWVLAYQPQADGIPSTYEWAVNMGPAVEWETADGVDHAKRYCYERLYVAVDDNGVRNVEWYGRKRVKAALEASANLLPFAQTEQRLYDALAEQNAWVVEQREGRLAPTLYELDIQDVRLGYSTVFRPDTGDYLLLPVWDCFGESTTHYDPDEVRAYNARHDTRIQALSSSQGGVSRAHSSLTLNAMDGSVIERNRGY